MNKIYKLKFDKRRNELVVVSEITAGMGKEKSTGHIADLAAPSRSEKRLGTLTPLALLTGLIFGFLPATVPAADLPAGGQVVGGAGSITTSGNLMTIHQQTPGMATNWHSFDIGKNSTVQFVQPDSSSVALNRVTGSSGSQIMGTLKANGQVFILNPNGVLFGKDARVNVAGLVASTKNISTADFMGGQYTLRGEGNPGAQVVNQGSLTTSQGGYIVLAGERVSNSGTVTTPSGKTVLAAGKTVALQLDNGGLTSVSVNGSVVNALVENRGLISATDGQVYLTAKGQDMLLNTVVNNSGTVEAKGLASRGGEIFLSGGDSGVVSQSGHLLADSQTRQGGKITLEGQNIHLAAGSLASATGKTGGGEVYVGGGWQGQDSRIKNASGVVMDKAATVDVSATENGNGGTAVLWSDDYTNFRGTVLAKGGARSGRGGRVETSSHRNLQVSGEVDASARAGQGGEWLLDPTDVTIVGTGTESGVSSPVTDGVDIFTPTASGAKILNSSVANQLNAGTNVTIKTSGADTSGQRGNITVSAPVNKTAGTDATLSLQADGNIRFNAAGVLNSTGGALGVDLKAGSNVYLLSNMSLNGGDLKIGGLTDTSPGPHIDSWDNAGVAAVLNVGNFSAQLTNVSGTQNAGFHLWGTRINATRDIDISVTTSAQPAAVKLEGNASLTAGGNITLSGTGTAGVILTNATLNASSGSARVTGNGSGNSALNFTTASITAGDITLNGTQANGSSSGGVTLTNVTLNASSGLLQVTGNSWTGGTGLFLSQGSMRSAGQTLLTG
ncbi:TPA: filamentous hemagglutinin N-terminal domain-containing protein, partial [Salmonella enterica subsp. houtenae]|nr:filamentous hemagglutinin N-terminal domain-containing protein [Salmonella enterica subsp. houtenae]